MNRKNLSFSLVAAMIAIFMTACGSSSKPKQLIIVAMTTPPPGALEIKLSAPLSATVTNDASSGGVLWTLACDTGADCGTLTAASSASGDTIGYTAPTTVPEGDVAAGGMLVVVTATSATDSTIFASANMVVFPVEDTSFLSGNYAFYVEGFDAAGFLYTAAGSVNLDGAGNVVSGEEDFFDAANATPSIADVIVGGSYQVGQDGRGSLTVDVDIPGSPAVPDPTVGVGGVETFSLVAVNNNHALIEEFDAAATSIGSMDFQTFTADDLTQLSGGFAYIVSGGFSGAPLGYGGVFTTDGAGGLGANEGDTNGNGILNTGYTGLTGGFTAPDASGRGTFTIGAVTLAYYIVNPEALSMVEIDGFELGVGVALGQGAATGTYTPASIAASVVGASGFTSAGLASIAGQFATDGVSALTSGFADSNENGAVIGTGSVTGTYTLGANGYGNFAITGGDLITTETDITTFGVYAVDPAVSVVDPNNSNQTGGALLLNLDTTATMTGVLSPQTDATDVFNTNNAISFNGDDTTGPLDLVGQLLSDGVSNLTGAGDQNEIFGTGQTPGVTLVGTFAPDAANPGRSTLALTVNGAATPNSIILYQASPFLNLNIDVDSTVQGSGYVEVQP